MTLRNVEQSLPFEILIPEELRQNPPDLKIASRFLDLLRASSENRFSIEVIPARRYVHTNHKELYNFLHLVLGAGHWNSLIAQIHAMAFPVDTIGALGQLCCLINGTFASFTIIETTPEPRLRWEISRGPA